MNYWPGTEIVKSTRNAFNWRAEPSEVTSTKEFKASVAAKRNAHMQKARQFTVYSKAKASK
jgi:hypothetical protein